MAIRIRYRQRVDSSQPSAAERERSYHAIRREAEAIEPVRPGAVETAAFLLSEAKASFERTTAESANLESKGTTLLGIVAGATSVFGVFGTRDGSIVVPTPVVMMAMTCVVGAMVCLFYVLRAKDFYSPNMSSYVSAAMVREDNRLGLALALAETYRFMGYQRKREVRRQGRALFWAYAAIAVATIALLFNAVTANRHAMIQPSGAPANAGTFTPKAKP